MHYAIKALLQSRKSLGILGRLCMVLGLWIASAHYVAGQLLPDSLGGLARKFSRYQKAALPEKLFLHLDRPFYSTGETMWFKVYAVEGNSCEPLTMSKVANVEVLTQENKPVLQAKVPLKQASGQGSFELPASLASGVYTVRAYTNWMRNFGPEYYFYASVTVINTFTASGAAAKDSSAGYAVRFFPEGGNLVQGIHSKIGFQATDQAGKGIAVEGKILSQTGAVITTFKTLRFGLGNFSFTPEAGNTYTALVTPKNSKPIRYKLPQVYTQGYAMSLDRPTNAALTITIRATTRHPETVYLLGHAGQKVITAARAVLLNGHALFTIEQNQLPDGISHFTLFDTSQKPLCERLYFQAPRSKLTITARPNKEQYALRDKVALDITTATAQGQSLGANMSMAVYRLDSLSASSPIDINSYLWLSADLKGPVETPNYYFTATGPEAAEAADNLMLTQGWSRFRWEQVLSGSPVALAYLPELYGPLLQAKLTQAGTNAPKADITTYFSSPSRLIRLSNAVSNAEGMVRFDIDDLYGSREIIVQTAPQQDSTSRIEIFPSFSERYAAAHKTNFAALPQLQQAYAKRHFQTQVQRIFATQEKRPLRTPRTDSLAFYGKPDETYFLDKYTRFKVLEEVMREYVPGVIVRLRKDGFHFAVIDKINKTSFTDNPMVLLDGVPIFNINKMMAMDPLKIQKLEVVDSRYMHGSSVYSGVVSFTTYKGDLEGFQLDPRVLVQQYEGLQAHREFYSPRYETAQEKQSRLPDMRNLLYWNPEINTTAGTARTLDFYTGDQAGRYLVVVQGLSDTGLAGSASFTIEVKEAL